MSVLVDYWEPLPNGEISIANCYDGKYLYFTLHTKIADFPKGEMFLGWHEPTITLETDDHVYIVLKEPRMQMRAELKDFNSIFFQKWEYLK